MPGMMLAATVAVDGREDSSSIVVVVFPVVDAVILVDVIVICVMFGVVSSL
jgi:hypothetical protein